MSSPVTRIATWAAAAAVGAGVFAAVSASGAVGGADRLTDARTTELVSAGAAAATTEPDDKKATKREERPARLRERLAGKRGGGIKAGGRVVHGEFVVRTKDGFRTVFVHKGEVTEVSATSITVKSADGFTKSYPVTGDTKVRDKGQPSTIGAVKPGSFAAVFGTRDGDAYTVRRIGVRPEPPAPPGAKPDRD